VGENDEANDSQELSKLFADIIPNASIVILPNVSHFGVFSEAESYEVISNFLSE